MTRIPNDVLAYFQKDVVDHRMTVIRDDGIYRHLQFKRPGQGAYWFDLITWPGALCIDGDMGTYVFRRLEDMFEFFRTDREYLERKGIPLAINPGYWSEKLTATCRDGHEKFEPKVFRAKVKEVFDEWVESERPDDDKPQALREEFKTVQAELWERLENDVLCCASDGDVRAYDAAREFRFDEDGWEFEMSDCWEWNCNQYTFHFVWCCYAIAWAIRHYDASIAEVDMQVTS